MWKVLVFQITILSLLAFPAIAQTWLQKSNLPFAIQNSEGTSFSIGDKVYIVGGVVNNNYSNFCWEYNTTTDSWTQKTSCPKCPPRWPSSFVVNGKGYCFGGYDTCVGSTNDLWEYDPVNDSWLQKSSLPDSVRAGAVGLSINNKGYIVGGAYAFGIILNDCWEYDPLLDFWLQKANMPCTGRVFGSGFTIGAKGYVGMGTTYSIELRDWWTFDPILDSWIITDSLPINGGSSEGSSFAIGNNGYFGPAHYSQISSSSFFRYDPSTFQWSQLANFPATQHTNCYCTSAQGKGYIISGNSFSACQNSTWEYTPPVGIEEFNTLSFTSFPNPASEFVLIHSDSLVDGVRIDLTAFDVAGQIVRKEVMLSANNEFTFLRAGLKPGCYFLEISKESGTLGRIQISFF